MRHCLLLAIIYRDRPCIWWGPGDGGVRGERVTRMLRTCAIGAILSLHCLGPEVGGV
jgi:hypothetical protein